MLGCLEKKPLEGVTARPKPPERRCYYIIVFLLCICAALRCPHHWPNSATIQEHVDSLCMFVYILTSLGVCTRKTTGQNARKAQEQKKNTEKTTKKNADKYTKYHPKTHEKQRSKALKTKHQHHTGKSSTNKRDKDKKKRKNPGKARHPKKHNNCHQKTKLHQNKTESTNPNAETEAM